MRFVTTVPFLIAVALPAQATIVHSAFDTPIYEDSRSMGGPGLTIAIKTQMPVTAVVTRIEVFTGERTGFNTLSIWSHVSSTNSPGATLGVGQWSMCQRNGWQGAQITNWTVPLPAGQDIWVVWQPQSGSQASSQGVGAGAQPYRGSFNGGTTWNGPFQSVQWKFRLWTGTAGHHEIYGAGCAGTAGTPQLCWSGMPLAGGSFDLHLDNAPAGGLVLLSLGLSDTVYNGTPLPFSLAGQGAPGCDVLAAPLVTVFGTADPAGSAVWPVSLVPDPALAGVMFYDQGLCLDSGANALGITVSNGGVGIVGF